MKISIYELLGLVKDGKAPKKIMYNNVVWEYIEYENDYRSRHNAELLFNDEINNTWIMKNLNTQIEILEEEKKIPEKLGFFDLTKDKNEKDENGNNLELHYTGVADTFDDVYEKINEIIDYLDFLKSKGDE